MGLFLRPSCNADSDSQASQLLNGLLVPAPSTTTSRIREGAREHPNFSVASNTPSRSTDGRYHYHGLVASQTQSQSSRRRARSLTPSSSQATKGYFVNSLGNDNDDIDPSTLIPTQLNTDFKESTEESSQDIPRFKPLTQSGHNVMKRRRNYEQHSEGNILVNSTSSASGSSHSEASQRHEDSSSIMSGRQPDYMDLDLEQELTRKYSGRFSEEYHVDPSLGFSGHWEAKEDDIPCPAELEPTQPSTQIEETISFPDGDILSSRRNQETCPNGDLHPLLQMVDPQKRRRYQMKLQYLPRSTAQASWVDPHATDTNATSKSLRPSSSHSSRIHGHPILSDNSKYSQTADAINEEAQPAFEDRKTCSEYRSSKKSRDSFVKKPREEEDYEIDVVPDSEPFQGELMRYRHIPVIPSNDERDIVSDSAETDTSDTTDELAPSRECDSAEPLAFTAKNLLRKSSIKPNFYSPLIRKTTEAQCDQKAYTPVCQDDSSEGRRQLQEVPSSAPEQDFSTAPVRKNCARTKRATKNVLKSTRGCRRTKPVQPRRQARSEGEGEDDDLVLKSEDVVAAECTEKEFTEQRVDDSLKRKRSTISWKSAPSSNPKDPAKPLQTPLTRQSKRLRAVASASRVDTKGATRVIARWKNDGYWYPGVVYSHDIGEQYIIKFDDETEGPATVDQMRTCDLQIGDNVMVTDAYIPRHHRSVKVVEVSQVAKDQIVTVQVDSNAVKVPVKSLKIAPKAISSAWAERLVDEHSIISVIKPERTRQSPASSQVSGGSAARDARKKLFEKTGIVVTISCTKDWEKQKGCVVSEIKKHGGSVIDDWPTVIRMEGKHNNLNQRWITYKKDVQWVAKEDINRVFLLADVASMKPKFLLALALGIPCISVAWLTDSVAYGTEKSWLPYLLPQGYSESLGTRLSQQVDVAWGETVDHLRGIMVNKVPSKLFDRLSILCIGQDMFPPNGKRASGLDDEGHQNAIARIILAMGAERVEAVTDLKHASIPADNFDLVVIKEAQHCTSSLPKEKTVHWQWVKESLIASRRLPLPNWI